mmetsp:Transcript_131014/g.365136  ORF Transcript_131014/g.365136 Transcript_131014/m.365136 type:complete len:82 (+) Transcript_131014:89-334(+)
MAAPMAKDCDSPALRKEVSWWDMAWLMLSDIVGTSVLVLPGVAYQLGWASTTALPQRCGQSGDVLPLKSESLQEEVQQICE